MGQAIGCSSCNNEPGNIKVPNSEFPFSNCNICSKTENQTLNIQNLQSDLYDDLNYKKTDGNINIEKIFNENILKVANQVTDSEIYSLTNDIVKYIEKNELKLKLTDIKVNYNNNLIKKEGYKFKKDNSIYKGSWNKKGKKEGFGIYINSTGDKYIGFFKNDLFNGKGCLINSNGNYFEGNFLNGKINGKGKLKLLKENYIYEGEFKEDKANGFGKENYNNIKYYEGNFINGKKEGEGIFKWNDGSIYKGNFLNGNINGKGFFEWKDGRKYNGEFLNGKIEGKGEFNWPNNHKYIGSYKNCKKNGFGIYYWNNNIFYEGNWVNNFQHGEGIFSNGFRRIKGIFRFGKLIQCSENKKIKNPNLKISFVLPDDSTLKKKLNKNNSFENNDNEFNKEDNISNKGKSSFFKND
jgi:hypothetical protein